MKTIEFKDQQFRIIKLLGRGKGGYSYLVTDGVKEYTLKKIHHEPCDYYTFGNKLESELRDYKTLSNLKLPLPKLIDVDCGKELILKEYIEGPTIMDLVKENRVKKNYLRQIKDLCKILYSNNLNIDYFPSNFIVKEDTLYYIDYECNQYDSKWNFENWGIKYWSKTPEFLEYLNNS